MVERQSELPDQCCCQFAGLRRAGVLAELCLYCYRQRSRGRVMPRFRAFGYNRVTLDGKVIEERDTLQCCHCNTTMGTESFQQTHWCSNCDWEHCSDPR